MAEFDSLGLKLGVKLMVRGDPRYLKIEFDDEKMILTRGTRGARNEGQGLLRENVMTLGVGVGGYVGDIVRRFRREDLEASVPKIAKLFDVSCPEGGCLAGNGSDVLYTNGRRGSYALDVTATKRIIRFTARPYHSSDFLDDDAILFSEHGSLLRAVGSVVRRILSLEPLIILAIEKKEGWWRRVLIGRNGTVRVA